MDKRFFRPELKKEYYSIPSKSVYHRALVLSAFSDRSTELVGRNPGEDVLATADCLRRLGAVVTETGDGFLVSPIDREKMKNITGITMDCRESGTTYRFMKELIDEFKLDIKLNGSERLLERVNSGAPTSQSISGRMLALGTRGTGIEIEAPEDTVSRPYIELTADIMTDFGGTGYDSPGRYEIEGDWSNSAVWACAAVITGKRTTILGLDRNTCQGDILVTDWLRKMGAVVYFTDEGVKISARSLRGIEIDGSFTPDIVPVISVTAAFAKGDTVIKNIGHLRYKESDRIEGTRCLIESLGGVCQAGNDYIIIKGIEKTGGLKGGTVDPSNDHRIAMAAALASYMTEEPVNILNAECVNKSYPGFWEVI